MTISGNIVSFKIGKKGDSTTDTVILQVVFSDPDDIRPVEWIPAPGEDSVPLIGSRVAVHQISSGYLVASGGNDGAVPVSDEGGKEIYSAVKDSSTVKKMARIRCLPDGTIELIADDINITGNVNIIGDVDIVGNQTNDGTIDATGNISSEGDISADGDVIADALATLITLLTHFHQGNLGFPTGAPIVSGGGSTPASPPSSDASGDVITGAGNSVDDLQAAYDAHGHPINSGSSAPGPTGTPT